VEYFYELRGDKALIRMDRPGNIPLPNLDETDFGPGLKIRVSVVRFRPWPYPPPFTRFAGLRLTTLAFA